MKTLLALVLPFLLISCAEYSGATYAGNGDAGGNSKLTEYRARTFMTDFTAGRFTSRGAVVAGQNQSRVPIAAVRAATTLGAASIMAGQVEALSNNSTREVLGAQQAATASEQIKSSTILGLGAQKLEETKVLNPLPPGSP